jgi:MerR HTH family regulatory protein
MTAPMRGLTDRLLRTSSSKRSLPAVAGKDPCFQKLVASRAKIGSGAVAGDLAISDVARVCGLRTSAIRYYEQIGILPPAMRKNGRRRYDKSALFRLAVVQRAGETGFTLAWCEMRRRVLFLVRKCSPRNTRIDAKKLRRV